MPTHHHGTQSFETHTGSLASFAVHLFPSVKIGDFLIPFEVVLQRLVDGSAQIL